MTVFNNKNDSSALVEFYVIKTIFKCIVAQKWLSAADIEIRQRQDFLRLPVSFGKCPIIVSSSISDSIQSFHLKTYFNKELKEME